MDRGSTSAFQAEIAKEQNKPIHLVSVETSGGTVYMTDAFKQISYGGNDYISVGYFLGFSEIEESSQVMVSNVTISLSGVDQSFIADFLSNDYIDRQVKIYLAFLDASNALVGDPVLYFDGRIDSPIVDDDPAGGKSILAVTATNAWVDFQRKTGRRGNHEEQQIHFAGDLGFEFASEIIRDIPWGRSS